MKSKIDRIDTSLRVEDLKAVLVTTAVSAIVFIFISQYFTSASEAILFSYAAVVGGILAVVTSFFECKDNDPFDTKTQSMGVINSFIGLGAVIVLGSFRFGLLATILVMDMLIVAARELGRRSRHNKEDKYMDRVGQIVKNDGHGKYVMNVDSDKVSVYSKEDLAIGNEAKVYDYKGSYLYVEKIDKAA